MDDRFFTYPDGSYVAVEDYDEVADAWRGDDFTAKEAIDYKEDGTPVFEGKL
jgi:hypothetical protein